MKIEFVNILRISELFKGVNIGELDKILNCLNPLIRDYKKRENVVVENDNFIHFGMVINGEVEISKEHLSGNKTVIANLSAGDIFGETIAFAQKKFWPATVITKTDCTIMFLTADKILNICKETCNFHKLIVSNIIRIISQKAITLNKKIEYLTIKSIQGKLIKFIYEKYLEEKSLTFSLPLNREELANFLNVSRPSLSRELCKLRDMNTIDFYKETIKINNLEQLKKILIAIT